MQSEAQVEIEVEAIPVTSHIIADMREAIEGGEHWFLALMAAVRNWPLPEEDVGGRAYHYLVGGEAFDWLLLAERLCEEIADLAPEEEAEELLFHGRFPADVEVPAFDQLLGAKYRGHLNFVYGVRVEEALQLAVQAEVFKDRQSRVWENGYLDEEVYTRLYGAPRQALAAEFREGHGLPPGEEISLSELQEFTYWLFKHRVKTHDPARVASDTRKGLAQLQQMEARLTSRQHAAGGDPQP